MAQARIVRAKGLVWLSTQQSHWQQGMASLAGRRFQVAFGNPWAAVVRKPGQELTEALSAIWEEPYGDRRTELVVIGQEMDHAAAQGRAAIEGGARRAQEAAEGYRRGEGGARGQIWQEEAQKQEGPRLRSSPV